MKSFCLLAIIALFFSSCLGQLTAGGIGSNLIPLGFHETILFKAGPIPPKASEILVTSNAPASIRVSPSSFSFPANRTSFLFVQLIAADKTTGPVTVTFSANGTDPGYQNFLVSYTVEVIQGCGVVYVDDQNCPAYNQWVYLGASLTRDLTTTQVAINVTIQESAGYALYFNPSANCPDKTNFGIRIPAPDDVTIYNRLGVGQIYQGVANGDKELKVRLGIQRTVDTQCTGFTAVIFDPNQDSVTPPILACTTELAVITCQNTLLGWQIAVIVVVVVVVVVVAVIVGVVLYKKRK